jgi:DNA-binding transcriptional ArsR family regulator
MTPRRAMAVFLMYHRSMTMIEMHDDAPASDGRALTVASCLFSSLGDPSRLIILRHLALGEHRVVDLTSHLGLAQSTVSKHLACLRDCGLVTSRPDGRASVFSLTQPQALLDLLAATEELLALTGDAVSLCPVFGDPGTRAQEVAAYEALSTSGAPR